MRINKEDIMYVKVIDGKEYITRSRAAIILVVNIKEIDKYIETGKIKDYIPPMKVARWALISLEEIERLLDEYHEEWKKGQKTS